jgi:hypothetical protein
MEEKVISLKCVWEFGLGLPNLLGASVTKTELLIAYSLVLSTEKTLIRTPRTLMYL